MINFKRSRFNNTRKTFPQLGRERSHEGQRADLLAGSRSGHSAEIPAQIPPFRRKLGRVGQDRGFRAERGRIRASGEL